MRLFRFFILTQEWKNGRTFLSTIDLLKVYSFLLLLRQTDALLLIFTRFSSGNSSNVFKDHVRGTVSYPLNLGTVTHLPTEPCCRFQFIFAGGQEYTFVLCIRLCSLMNIWEIHSGPMYPPSLTPLLARSPFYDVRMIRKYLKMYGEPLGCFTAKQC